MSDVIGFDKLFNAGSFDEGTRTIAQYIERITYQIGEAKKAADQLTVSLGKQLKDDIAQLSAQSQNLSKDMADMANKMANFQQTTSNTKKVLSDYEKENEKLKKQLQQLKTAQEGNTKAAKDSTAAFTTKLKSMIGLASGAAIVYKGIQIMTEQFKLALKSTMEFETAMKQVQAISRASAEDIKLLTENANRLGATTEKTAGQIASLQKELAKLGFNTTEILASTDAIVDLSTATGEDLASSAIVAAATLRAFGLDAIEMGRVVDVMAGSFVRSGLDLEKFRESMKLVAPIARAAGFDLEVTTAALSKLADAGLSGSLAGTALRNLFSSMADPTEKLTKFLGKLDSSLAGGVKTSEQLTRAFKLLNSAGIDLAQATEMVDVRAKTAFLTLVNQADSIEGLTLEYKILDGEANKIADTMRDTLTNDVEILNSAFDALRRNITEQFTPSLRTTAQTLTTFTELFRLMINEFVRANDLTNEVGEQGIISSILFGTERDNPNELLTIVKGIMGTLDRQVELGKAAEEMDGLSLSLSTVKNSLKTVDGLTHSFDQLGKMVKGKDFKSIGGIFTYASNEAVGLGEEVDIIKRKIQEGVITEEEGGRALFSISQRVLTSMSSSVVQIEERKVLLQKELKEHERINGEVKEGSKEWIIQKKLKKEIADIETFIKSTTSERVKLEKANAIIKKEGAKLSKDTGEDLNKTNKKLDEQIRLTYQLNDAKLKGELTELGKAKKSDDFTVQIALEEEIANKKKEIAELRYAFELRQIEELYKKDKDYLLRRQVATQNFANEVVAIQMAASDAISKIREKEVEDNLKLIETALKESVKTTDDAIKVAKKAGFAALDVLAKKRKDDQDQKDQDAKDDKKREKEKWDTITQITQQAAQGLSRIGTFMFDNAQIRRDNELKAIDVWEQEKLDMAGDNEEAKKRIELQAERRRQEIRRKQAIANRDETMFQIVLDTAAAMVKAFAASPKSFGMPFIAAAAALGAAQLAIVKNRPLPQFYKGTDDSPEGFAKVGERGRELVQDGKTKQWSITPDKTTVAYLTKGSKVITNAETERVLAQDHNGRANQFLQSKVIVKDNNKINYKMIGQEVGRAVSTIPVNITNFDEKGVTKYVMKRSSKITRLNKRY